MDEIVQGQFGRDQFYLYTQSRILTMLLPQTIQSQS